MRLSQTDHDLMGHDLRKSIGNKLRFALAESIEEDPMKTTTYWYPFADAQNAAFLEAEVYYIGDDDEVEQLQEFLKTILERQGFPIPTNLSAGVWFPLMPDQPYVSFLVHPATDVG